MKVLVSDRGRTVLVIGAALCICLVGGSLSVANPDDIDFASQHPDSLVITRSTDKSSYTLGSDVFVTIQKKDVLLIPLQTDVLADSIDYDVVIRNGSVEMQPLPASLRHSLIVEAPHRPFQLGPGHVVTDPGTQGMSSPISDWGLKIAEPGTYVLTAISHETKQQSNAVTITVSLASDPSATPQPQPVFFRAIPAATIPDNGIGAHIPRSTDPADRGIVREVMEALPPTKRQFVIWLHVPPGKDGYQDLTNHGLIVMYDENVLQSNGSSARLAGAGYVLYFDGRVHLDSQFVYGSSLSRYLTIVAYGFNSKRRVLFKAIPAAMISNNRIDAHIPADTDPADRNIVRQVMTAIPPTSRQFIIWLHVPPGKGGYEELPNHGLIVMYYDNPDVDQIEAKDLPGLYVLYFDGKVQRDSNLIYAPSLDSYLTVVPDGVKTYLPDNK